MRIKLFFIAALLAMAYWFSQSPEQEKAYHFQPEHPSATREGEWKGYLVVSGFED